MAENSGALTIILISNMRGKTMHNGFFRLNSHAFSLSRGDEISSRFMQCPKRYYRYAVNIKLIYFLYFKGLTTDHYMWLVVFLCPVMVSILCTSQNPLCKHYKFWRDIPIAVGYIIIAAPCIVR